MTTVHGTTLDIPTQDGVVDAYLAHPDDGRAHPGVLLYMDAFGLRASLEAMARRLAGHGYTVLVPNVLYRTGRAPVVELPDFINPAERPEIFEQLFPIIRELTPERAVRDAGAYLDWLAASPLVADGPVGTTGYCLGGVLALRTAAAHPDRIAAVASFHAGHLTTDAEDSPHRIVDRITAEVYFGHADQDSSLPAEAIKALEQALDTAGVRYRSEVYEGAQHGYTQTDTAVYNGAADNRHWRNLLELFGRTLG
ncbi:dienelactone hydrolase family protein [Streptomyces endophytica]|uniref:Dienelactone hydrolase family protein n=1 Tax=Streptomyces endophytica TaxID=2991496 RepID=A0ABY6PI57_9ACTN|nr:dienelactone hydrolase family protein [Streptomyces endophytica]UZJ33125.1 dienelactone hydrolase family protein [Streptomyces endophytica]